MNNHVYQHVSRQCDSSLFAGPRKYTEEELVDEVIAWLNAGFVKDDSSMLDIGVNDSFVCESEDSLELHGRDEGISKATGLFDKRWVLQGPSRTNKTENPVGLLGAATGLGKTRLLSEMSKSLALHISSTIDAKNYAWYTPVLATYNSGNAVGEDEKSEDDNTRANLLALRVLFHGVKVGGATVCSDFKKFVERIKMTEFSEQIRFSTTVSVIQRIMDQKNSTVATDEVPGILFIGLDEYNLLLRSSPNIEKRREPLRGAVNDIATAMKARHRKVFIFPVFSGTAVQPLQDVFTETTHQIRAIPLALLQEDEVEDIVMAFAAAHKWPNDWLESKMRMFLSDYGKHPRTLQKILWILNDVLDNAETGKGVISKTSVSQGFVELKESFYARGIATSPVAVQVLAHGIVNFRVVREYHIDQLESKQTYGELEDQGKLLLSTVNGKSVVSLSYPWVDVLSRVILDAPYYAVLRKLINRMSDEKKLTWQDFEECSLLYDALREMSLSRCGQEEATLEELYPGSRGQACILEQKYNLSKDVVVDYCKNQVNGDENIVTKEDETVAGYDVYKHSFLNADGALHDSFHDRLRRERISRNRFNDVRSRIVKQCTFLDETVLNKETLEREVKKVKRGVEGTDLQDEIVVVVFATKLSRELKNCKSEDFPDCCIVLSDRALYNYFGNAFQYRMFMDILPSTQGVFVNTDGFSMLRKVPQINDVLARKIIDTRLEQHFKDWNDLKNRVSFIPDAAIDSFYFGKQERTILPSSEA